MQVFPAQYHLSDELYLLKPEKQHAALQEKLAKANKEPDPTIYLLRSNKHALREQMHNAHTVLLDIDGTCAEVGADTLTPGVPAILHALQACRMKILAVTGRHAGQMNVLEQNHSSGTGFNEAIIESGAYVYKPGNTPEQLLATKEIEDTIAALHRQLDGIIGNTIRDKGYRIESTCVRDNQRHKTMFSVDILHQNGGKITSQDDHTMLVSLLELNPPPGYSITSSSIGTVEITPGEIDKSMAVYQWMLRNKQGGRLKGSIICGDGNNDLPLFNSGTEGLRSAVINPHTSRDLIAHADVATVGPGNVLPVLQLIHAIRSAATQIGAA